MGPQYFDSCHPGLTGPAFTLSPGCYGDCPDLQISVFQQPCFVLPLLTLLGSSSMGFHSVSGVWWVLFPPALGSSPVHLCLDVDIPGPSSACLDFEHSSDGLFVSGDVSFLVDVDAAPTVPSIFLETVVAGLGFSA